MATCCASAVISKGEFKRGGGVGRRRCLCAREERIVEQEVFAAASITGTAVGRVAKRSGSATAAGRAGAPP